MVAINRTTKVVKGGRRFGFAALVVANQKSIIGQGKSKQVPDAIKATEVAKKYDSNPVKRRNVTSRCLCQEWIRKNFNEISTYWNRIIAGGAMSSL